MTNNEFIPVDERPFLMRQLIRNLLHSEIDRANAEYFMAQHQDNREASKLANTKIHALLSTESWFEELTKQFDP
jgi:hypothetical protein